MLVHIGPPKTGTTSLQAALRARRPELLAHGVVYPGRGQRQKRPGFALLGRVEGGRAVPMSEWQDLVAEVRGAGAARVCVSTESFARAGRTQIRSIVEDLGRDRVHMVVTARRLDRLMPSAWQQRIKSVTESLSYADWLDQVLDPARPDGASATFWRHHDLVAKVGAWGRVLPPERIHVIVADEADRGQLLRVFEGLLSLPPGLLSPEGGARPTSNTSLSYERAELLRHLNIELGELEGKVRRQAVANVRRGLIRAPRAASESGIPPVSGAALARVAELSEARAEGLRASGVQIIGDLESLRISTDGVPAAPLQAPDAVPIEAVVSALAALVSGLPGQEPAALLPPSLALPPEHTEK